MESESWSAESWDQLMGSALWYSSIEFCLSCKMVGVTNFNKIFKGRKLIPEEELRASLVSGGVMALAEKLREAHGWNGTSLLAAPFLTLEAGAVVDTYWAVWNISLLIKAADLCTIVNDE